MNYREATTEQRVVRIHQLQNTNKKTDQDTLDLAAVATTYMNLVRCPSCMRLAAEGFTCVHCGDSEG